MAACSRIFNVNVHVYEIERAPGKDAVFKRISCFNAFELARESADKATEKGGGALSLSSKPPTPRPLGSPQASLGSKFTPLLQAPQRLCGLAGKAPPWTPRARGWSLRGRAPTSSPSVDRGLQGELAWGCLRWGWPIAANVRGKRVPPLRLQRRIVGAA